MAMEVVQVQNFAHYHPLMLIKKEETDDSWDLSCYGCQQPISISSSDSSSYYGCKRCAFFLHKICAEPPDKMTHPSHPQHPLTLLPNTPSNYNSSYAVCDVCRERFNRFTYHCSLCKYDIDMKCALAVLSIQQSIKHTSHPHQLIPLQMESMFLCYACGIEHKGTSFLCTTCGFWINQKCASSPPNLNLNNRHRHALSLIYSIPGPKELHCSICSEEIFRRSWAYSCSECHYTVHLHCAVSDKESNETENQSHVQVQSLGHDHPLKLIKKEETDDSWDLSCYACQQPIWISSSDSSSYYGCKRCAFFLHKICAEPPNKMTHPSHPQHPLTLLPNPISYSVTCDVCRGHCNRFVYRCYNCNYDINMKCALAVLSIQQSIEHTSHPHQLIPMQKESMFSCDACGIKHEGTSFLCTTCGFWINQKCASSPPNLNLNNRHRHALSLIYSIPGRPREIHCSICSEEIFRRSWAYSCSKCHYLVHFHCAVSDKESNETENQSHDLGLNPINLCSSNLVPATSDADLHKVISLPVPDDSADMNHMITQFIKNTPKQRKHEGAAKIKHGSHCHLLTLKKPIDHALPLSNGAGNVQKCRGCAQSISAPFYCCVECEFYLHVWCAELPEELQHLGHPQHTLFLSKDSSAITCGCCNLFGTTLSYECEKCHFYLDCKCASLPRVIKHKSHHRHNLALRPTPGTCISCNASLRISFECWSCKFNLCVRCAILPHTVKHKYDKHPFTLTYSPRPYRTDDDFCEICEEGMDSNRWFYHCGECDQYLHTDCIHPVDQFSNMVYFPYWEPINSRKHPHRLIHVTPGLKTSCSLCERRNPDSGHYYCPPCQFRLCSSCAGKGN